MMPQTVLICIKNVSELIGIHWYYSPFLIFTKTNNRRIKAIVCRMLKKWNFAITNTSQVYIHYNLSPTRKAEFLSFHNF